MVLALALSLAHAIPGPPPGPPPTPPYMSQGSGTANDPWIIDSAAELQSIGSMGCNATLSAACDDHFRQTAHIDMSGLTLTPIGRSSNPFVGTYDGQEYLISNATVNKPTWDDVGLFGYTVSATLRDIWLDGPTVAGDQRAGSLLGYAAHNTTIDGCGAAEADVWGTSDIGGLVGQQSGGEIIDSFVVESYVEASAATAGGLVGDVAYADLVRSYVLSSIVEANSAPGGLAGSTTYAVPHYSPSLVQDCFARATVIGTNAGGLISSVAGTAVIDSYAASVVSGSGSDGLVASPGWASTFDYVYWDTTVSGDTTAGPSGTYGRTTAQMKQATTFAAIWDWQNTWNIVTGYYPSLY